MNLSPKQICDDILLHNMNQNTEETLSRLKFLGYIQKDEKLDIKNVCRQPNNFITKITRTIFPDNRINTLNFIKDIITKTFEILKHNFEFGSDSESSKIQTKNIILDLIRSKQGIENLKKTYNSDTKFCCDIDILLEHISTELVNLKIKNGDLFENKEEN
jgi:hypothetical protein